jgi:putative flippase GtrA
VLAQLVRFGGVGLLATLCHVLVALAVERVAAAPPQGANLAGFAAGVLVSYAGHARVTFGAPIQSAPRFLRFILTSLLGLVISSTTVWVASTILDLGFPVAMLCVAILVPMVTYLGMRFWVFDGRSEERLALGDILVPVGLGLGVVAVFWGRLVNHDVAWYLFATRDWLAGARLYEDLVEVNPPLAFYLTVPSLLIADATGINDMQGHYVAVALLLACSLIWSARVLREAFPFSPRQRAIFLAAAGLAVLLPALNGLGQREQVMVLCFLPWALREAAPRPPTPVQTLASAGFAAVGMCLKPHFVVLPLAVTLLNCFEARSLRPVLSLSNRVFLAVGIAYVGFVWAMHPAYLTDILPMAVEVYGAYGKPLGQMISGIAFPLAFVVLWVVICLRSQKPDRPAVVFLVLAAGGLATYLLQGTGFSYHKVPFIAFSAMAAGLVLLGGTRNPAPTVAAACVIASAAWVGLHKGFYRNNALTEIQAIVAKPDDVRSLMTLSSHVYTGPPIAMALGADWASTYPADWLVPGALNRLRRTDCTTEAETCTRLEAIAARNRAANMADLAQYQPDLLIVDRSSGNFDEEGFDWLAFMDGDPGWAPVFANYRPLVESDRFLYFLRIDRTEKTPP